jgi:hypothetical protein
MQKTVLLFYDFNAFTDYRSDLQILDGWIYHLQLIFEVE